MPPSPSIPYKSLAAALLMSIFLGPIGLLYASIWGGLVALVVLIFMLINHFYFLAALTWFAGCIWSVRSVEKYNKNLFTLIS